MKSVKVVRIGHRYVRDYRTLTHLCLVSRALGAETIYLEEVEPELEARVHEVNETWGGDFAISQADWRTAFRAARQEGRTIVHLTMYGLPLHEKLRDLLTHESFLVAIGGPKVPAEVYSLADQNIAVTSQPHSEIAALAILLHELQGGEELKKVFEHSRLWIVPSERRKQVEQRK